MTFAQLHAFATVARLGSVKAAAAALGVSEPAVSAARRRAAARSGRRAVRPHRRRHPPDPGRDAAGGLGGGDPRAGRPGAAVGREARGEGPLLLRVAATAGVTSTSRGPCSTRSRGGRRRPRSHRRSEPGGRSPPCSATGAPTSRSAPRRAARRVSGSSPCRSCATGSSVVASPGHAWRAARHRSARRWPATLARRRRGRGGRDPDRRLLRRHHLRAGTRSAPSRATPPRRRPRRAAAE